MANTVSDFLLQRLTDWGVRRLYGYPGDVSDDAVSNEHPTSEQWLYLISGTGQARIGKRHSSVRTVKLRAQSLLLIEKGELHQIKNTGRQPLQTINFYFYGPPAYNKDGQPL
jgi:hypothetical protein